MKRIDGRRANQLRQIKMTRGWAPYAEGSCLIELGDTKVLCTASVEDRVPPHLNNKNQGWVTGEYSMLPRSTHHRSQREARSGRQGGRTLEIQRLIGRSLRAVTDMKRLGPRTIIVDCDVLTADGGTRTAAITGGMVALVDACRWLVAEGLIKQLPIEDMTAAVSVGMLDERLLVDLCYREDSRADVDFNVIATGRGRLVEVQGTAEGTTFTHEALDLMVSRAMMAIRRIVRQQRRVLGPIRLLGNK